MIIRACLKLTNKDFMLKTLQVKEDMVEGLEENCIDVIKELFYSDKKDIEYPKTESIRDDECFYTNIVMSPSYKAFNEKNQKWFEKDGDETIEIQALRDFLNKKGNRFPFIVSYIEYENQDFVCFLLVNVINPNIDVKSNYWFFEDKNTLKEQKDIMFSFLKKPVIVLKVETDENNELKINNNYKFNDLTKAKKIFSLEHLISMATTEEVNKFIENKQISSFMEFPKEGKINGLLRKRDKENFSYMIKIQEKIGFDKFKERALEVVKEYCPNSYNKENNTIIFTENKDECSNILKYLSDKMYKGLISGEKIENTGRTDLSENNDSTEE